MPKPSAVGGFDVISVLPFVFVFASIVVPLVLGRRGAPPEGTDDDSDGGGGSGPPHPRPPVAPRGGIPLPDATPARVRLRGHERLADRLPARERRPAREPGHAPLRPRT